MTVVTLSRMDDDVLHLDGRGPDELPAGVRELPRLRHLDVRNNRLTSLPEWLSELPALESLSIGENPLRGIPTAVTKLTRLRRLYAHEIGRAHV